MMNKKKTSRIGLLKYAFLLPVTGLLILAGNARAVTDLASHTLIQAARKLLIQRPGSRRTR